MHRELVYEDSRTNSFMKLLLNLRLAYTQTRETLLNPVQDECFKITYIDSFPAQN